MSNIFYYGIFEHPRVPIESLFFPTDQGKSHVRIIKRMGVYTLAAGAHVEVHTHPGGK